MQGREGRFISMDMPYFKKERELKEAILSEKKRGTPDIEIGRKYGVSFKYIEKVVTEIEGVNISEFNKPKRIKLLRRELPP